jgi:hypothetical protein
MAASVSFIIAPDRASSWLVRSRHETGLTDALLPPGSVSPLDRSARMQYWTRCSWSQRNAQPRFEAPEDCKVVRVNAAVREARRWGGHDRWVLQETLDYIDLLLTHVSERTAYDGRLTREVSTVLADPALDLLGELREASADEEHPDYATMIDCELANRLSPAFCGAPQIATGAPVEIQTVCCRDASSAIAAAILRAIGEAPGDEQ